MNLLTLTWPLLLAIAGLQQTQLAYANSNTETNSSNSNLGLDEDDEEVQERETGGTPERTEFEYKNAFSIDKSVNIPLLLRKLNENLAKYQTDEKLKFPKLFKSEYSVEKKLVPFVFKDIYLDTDDLAILKNNSSYRLRYRWNQLSHYSRYQWLPFLKNFYPTRCEIQFKRDYKIDLTEGSVSVQESRFEFRNEADPFTLNNDAPSSPWPEDDYLGYAKTGVYNNYEILPTQILQETTSIPLETNQLKPQVRVQTIRYRTHIIAKGNPWSWGQNPNQVFIISIDLSTWEHTNGSRPKTKLLEVEIEADRNTSTMIDLVKNSDHGSENGFIQRQAQLNSKLAYEAIKHDQLALRTLVLNTIESLNQGKALPTNYKYARMMKGKR